MKKNIKGKECASYKRNDFEIWISNDGKYVSRCGKNGHVGKPLKINVDVDGPFVLSASEHAVRISIARAVIESFCPPPPSNGRHMVRWKDSDKNNNDYTNLEWVPYHYTHSVNEKEMVYRQSNLLEVRKDGTVWCHGHQERVVDVSPIPGEWYLRWPDKHPFITLDYQNKLPVDDLMRDCGYVQGDDAGMNDPVILHRDNNYKNFASDNLEWVERSDPRYADFLKQRLKDREDACQASNGSYPRPENFVNEDSTNEVLVVGDNGTLGIIEI